MRDCSWLSATQSWRLQTKLKVSLKKITEYDGKKQRNSNNHSQTNTKNKTSGIVDAADQLKECDSIT